MSYGNQFQNYGHRGYDPYYLNYTDYRKIYQIFLQLQNEKGKIGFIPKEWLRNLQNNKITRNDKIQLNKYLTRNFISFVPDVNIYLRPLSKNKIEFVNEKAYNFLLGIFKGDPFFPILDNECFPSNAQSYFEHNLMYLNILVFNQEEDFKKYLVPYETNKKKLEQYFQFFKRETITKVYKVVANNKELFFIKLRDKMNKIFKDTTILEELEHFYLPEDYLVIQKSIPMPDPKKYQRDYLPVEDEKLPEVIEFLKQQAKEEAEKKLGVNKTQSQPKKEPKKKETSLFGDQDQDQGDLFQKNSHEPAQTNQRPNQRPSETESKGMSQKANQAASQKALLESQGQLFQRTPQRASQGASQGGVQKNQKNNDDIEPLPLPNVGNSCYINSTIQCLGSCAQLKNFVIKNKGEGGEILRGFGIVFEEMKEGRIISEEMMMSFRNILKNLNIKYSSYEQQDSGELIVEVLDRIRDEIRDSELKKEFSNLIYSELVSQVEGSKDNVFEEFNLFPLDFPDPSTYEADEFTDITIKFYHREFCKPPFEITVPFKQRNLTIKDLRIYINIILQDTYTYTYDLTIPDEVDEWFIITLPALSSDPGEKVQLYFNDDDIKVEEIFKKLKDQEVKLINCYEFSYNYNYLCIDFSNVRDSQLNRIRMKIMKFWENKTLPDSPSPLMQKKKSNFLKENCKIIILDFIFGGKRVLLPIPLLINTSSFCDLHCHIFCFFKKIIGEPLDKFSSKSYFGSLQMKGYESYRPFNLLVGDSNNLSPLIFDEGLKVKEIFSEFKITIYVEFTEWRFIGTLAQKLLPAEYKKIFFDDLDLTAFASGPLIKSSYTLDECLQVFFEGYCEKEGKKLKKTYNIKRLPKLLIFQLNRYKSPVTKDQSLIEFKEEIKVANKSYRLVAVCCHMGSTLFMGHYYAYIYRNKKWYYASDQLIYKEDKPASKDKSEPYLFFYQEI